HRHSSRKRIIVVRMKRSQWQESTNRASGEPGAVHSLKGTPAMAAGILNREWGITDLLDLN
ncbi:MAG: hypothetical protein L0Y74_04000, partial [candidate division Zixibacteria bacterium]|nr:hypothetical protein [candidate division Zixibacteria bacterium]